MKKIINTPETIVREMCKGFVLANPTLEFVEKYKIVKKKNIDKNKVSLISGGGSGHEPAHAGFVGKGMLDAAVCGDVFASPSQVQVYQAIKATASDKGTLLIIKNYSGDMMNFQSAAYLAEMDNITVDYVKVEDDIAVQDSLYTVGRRGVAGTVFVHKIAGAAAQKGLELAEVKRIAQKAADNVRSLGFAFTSCTVPGFSMELCGGSHVKNIGQIGMFKIIGESGVAAGVRRIEAITGKAAIDYMNAKAKLLQTAITTLKTNESNLCDKIANLLQENKEMKAEIAKVQAERAKADSNKLLMALKEYNGVNVIVGKIQAANMDELRNNADLLCNKFDKAGVVVLGAILNDKVNFVVKVNKDGVARGLHAGKIVKEVAMVTGGNGGGV